MGRGLMPLLVLRRWLEMVGARKEYRLWGCLNEIIDIIKAVECCKAFGLTKDEEDKAISLWENKRIRRLY
jgi:hypothetical protein